MKPRAKDIAEKLNISPATVSLVLNNKPGVSEKTRKKVLDTMKEEGFGPSIIPINMKNKNGNIRFVIYKKYNHSMEGTPFFSELIEGIDRQTRTLGYNMGITYMDEQKDDIEQMLVHLKKEKPEGILILATEMEVEDVQRFKSLDIPFVIIDNYFEGESVDQVCIDNSEGAYEAIRELVSLGHKKIGYLHSSVRIHNFIQRMRGVQKAIRLFELDLNPEYVFCLEARSEHAFDTLVHMYKHKKGPTALFADNDTMAYAAIRALQANGIQVPQEVSVIGFDDMPICEMFEPNLTTIHVYRQQIGMYAIKRLAEIIEDNPKENLKIFVGTKLIKRDSTSTYPAQ